jgi:tripartite-type tricarboxylate transporter receptor subunit TctC
MFPRKLLLALTGAAAAICSYPAPGQEYPSKPIRVVIAYGAGSGLDALNRQMAQEMSATWKQPVLVENRPGASGIIAAETCKKAPPDGYLVCMLTRDLFLLPFLMKDLSFDPVKDFKPVTKLVNLTQVIVAHPSVGANSMKDFLAIAKARPGKLNYASLGTGSGINLLFEWMRNQYGLDIVHVPYKNPVDLVQATVSGEVSVTMLGTLNFLGQIRAGKVKVLAVSGPIPQVPGVPSLAEQGIGFDVNTWFGYFVPAGTPNDVVQRLRDEVARIYSIPSFREKNLIDQALIPVANTPEEFARSIPRDVATGAEVVRITGARLE